QIAYSTGQADILDDIEGDDAVGAAGEKVFEDDPLIELERVFDPVDVQVGSAAAALGAVHQVDRALAPGDFSAQRPESPVEAQVAHGRVDPLHLHTPDLGVEVLVRRRTVDDLRDVIAFIIVVEGRAVQDQRAAEKRILGPDL